MFNKHFKPDKKVLIQITGPDFGDDRIENLSASCLAMDKDILTLNLPYAVDPSTFASGYRLAVLTESMGMGLKGQACFLAQPSPTTIQLCFDGDLQFFQRRPSPRLNIPIGVRYSRIDGTLSQVRQQWLKHIGRLAATPPGSISHLPRGMVNLSSGGIRLGFRHPIDKAQLCLMLLEIDPDTHPVCTMAEVVWSHQEKSGSVCLAGMQFMGMLTEDQKRLEKFVRTAKQKTPEAKQAPDAS